LGLDLVPASAPDFFTHDAPTAVLVREVLGAISQLEKATLVAKLKAARDRKRTGKAEGRKSHAEMRQEVVAQAPQLRRKRGGRRLGLRDISAELARQGHVNMFGRPFAASSINGMLAPARRPRAAP
jgi:hypothetical protein